MSAAGITLAQAQAQLDAWLAADAQLATSQRYEIDTGNGRRMLQRADAAEVRENIKYWNEKVKELTPSGAGGRRRIRYPVRG